MMDLQALPTGNNGCPDVGLGRPALSLSRTRPASGLTHWELYVKCNEAAGYESQRGGEQVELGCGQALLPDVSVALSRRMPIQSELGLLVQILYWKREVLTAALCKRAKMVAAPEAILPPWEAVWTLGGCTDVASLDS